MTGLTGEILAQLSEPFDPKLVSWKPQTAKNGRALAVSFADTRAYMDRLDAVVGADWSDRYQVFAGGSVVLCELTILGVTRSDIGEASPGDQNMATSALSQAFKRASSRFGLGRFLYAIPAQWVDYDPEGKRFTPAALAQLERLAGGKVANGGSKPSGDNGRKPAADNGAFGSKGAMVTWAMTQAGAFEVGQHCANALNKLQREHPDADADELSRLWRADVGHRLAAKERDEALPADPPDRGRNKLFKS